MNFAGIPPGLYALALLHATGIPHPQQVSLILANPSQQRWMLAGFFSKPLMEAGHDGLWYWVSARKYSQMKMNWDAWLYYRMATYLLDPIDLLSSSHLEKLQKEADEVRPANLPGTTPMPLSAHGSTFSVTSIEITTALGELDLDIHYVPNSLQASGLHDPPAARKQVVEVMSALLEEHPELPSAFHGIWVHADQVTNSLFALELPIDQICVKIAPNSIPQAH